MDTAGSVSAPEVAPTQALARRAKHQKNRTGCLRCKSRRVRCDETKPQCQRCIRINVTCPGYSIPQARIFGLSNEACFRSDFDRKCFDSFITNGTRDLMASQPSARDFWLRYVPQLGQVHPAIRHATIAISVMQEPLVRPDVTEAFQNSVQDIRAIATSHFNESIRSFLQNNPNFRVESQLTCCLLFHVLTMYLERITPGATHVNAADWYLKEHEKAIARGQLLFDPIVALGFAPIVQTYIVDAATFVDGFQNRFGDCGNAYEMFQNLLPDDSDPFPTIETINESLKLLINYAIGYHLREFGHSMMLEGLRTTLARFNDLIERHSRTVMPQPHGPQFRNTDEKHIHFLRLHHRAALVFAHSLRDDENTFDNFTQIFHDMISLCDRITSLGDDTTWSSGMGILSPLFLVSTKCRDTELRRRALKLLHNTKRVENTWSSCMAATLANAVIKQEEELNSLTPGSVNIRVSLQAVAFSAQDRLMYYRYSTLNNGQHLNTTQDTLPYTPITLRDGSSGLGLVSHRILWACGYNGPVFSTPHIQCHCELRFE